MLLTGYRMYLQKVPDSIIILVDRKTFDDC